MAQAKENWASGEYDTYSDRNQVGKNANDAGGFRDNINAGEAISAFRPVFLHDTDEEWYYCDADDKDRLNFDGFSLEAGSDGNPMKVQLNGVVRGFSGLDAGKKYYVQDDGTIGTSPGTYQVLVGIAISSSELLIIKKDWREELKLSASDTLQVSADTQRTTTSSTYVKVKEIKVYKKGTYRVKFDLMRTNDKGYAYGRIYKNGVAYGTERSTLNYTSFDTFSEDLAFDEGDLVQLYIRNEIAGYNAYTRNFRLYYDLGYVNTLGNVITD